MEENQARKALKRALESATEARNIEHIGIKLGADKLANALKRQEG